MSNYRRDSYGGDRSNSDGHSRRVILDKKLGPLEVNDSNADYYNHKRTSHGRSQVDHERSLPERERSINERDDYDSDREGRSRSYRDNTLRSYEERGNKGRMPRGESLRARKISRRTVTVNDGPHDSPLEQLETFCNECDYRSKFDWDSFENGVMCELTLTYVLNRKEVPRTLAHEAYFTYNHQRLPYTHIVELAKNNISSIVLQKLGLVYPNGREVDGMDTDDDVQVQSPENEAFGKFFGTTMNQLSGVMNALAPILPANIEKLNTGMFAVSPTSTSSLGSHAVNDSQKHTVSILKRPTSDTSIDRTQESLKETPAGIQVPSLDPTKFKAGIETKSKNNISPRDTHNAVNELDKLKSLKVVNWADEGEW